jgi:hypothetical protein
MIAPGAVSAGATLYALQDAEGTFAAVPVRQLAIPTVLQAVRQTVLRIAMRLAG